MGQTQWTQDKWIGIQDQRSFSKFTNRHTETKNLNEKKKAIDHQDEGYITNMCVLWVPKEKHIEAIM